MNSTQDENLIVLDPIESLVLINVEDAPLWRHLGYASAKDRILFEQR